MALKPALPAQLLENLDSPSGVKRAELWLARFRDLCEQSGTLEAIHRELHAALTESVVSTRVPDPKARNGWTYALLPDAGIRVTSARLLMAYLAGLAPSQSDIRIQHVSASSDRPRDVLGMLDELKQIGVGLSDLAADIERQAKRSEPVLIETERRQ